MPLGESRFGGLPDVPLGFQWSRWDVPQRRDLFGAVSRESRKNAPLDFIAQIRLSDLRAIDFDSPLPATGYLYFFYDMQSQPWGYDPVDARGSRVLYVADETTELARLDAPVGVTEGTSEPCALVFEPQWTLPHDWQGGDDYWELQGRLAGNSDKTIHRILGHPQIIQNPMELECQLASHGIDCGTSSGYQSAEAQDLAEGAPDWRLLLQVDSDSQLDWCWGDAGRIYYWIKEQDLARRKFDETWLILQCY